MADKQTAATLPSNTIPANGTIGTFGKAAAGLDPSKAGTCAADENTPAAVGRALNRTEAGFDGYVEAIAVLEGLTRRSSPGRLVRRGLRSGSFPRTALRGSKRRAIVRGDWNGRPRLAWDDRIVWDRPYVEPVGIGYALVRRWVFVDAQAVANALAYGS